MAKIPELNGLIHSKFPSESVMADEMGWSRQRLNRITNKRKMPDLQETAEIANALGKPLTFVANIFLASWSPNGD